MQMRVWPMISLLALACLGCDDAGGGGSDGGAGGGGGGGQVPAPIEGNANTLAYAAAYDAMAALVAGSGFSGAAIGDPTPFISGDAATPSQPGLLSSLWYESGDLDAAVGRVRDRRTGLSADDQVGGRITQRVSLALTLGGSAEGTGRNGPRWYGLTVVRALDQFFLLATWTGLGERSAAGYDRALGALWTETGSPHGIGAVIAAADAACGTRHLAAIGETLSAVRADFIAELANSGLPDALGRNVIAAGALPAYDEAIDTVEGHLTAGLALAFLHGLDGDIDASVQAAGLAAFEALSARVRASGVEGADRIPALLDAADPSGVDAGEIRRLVGEALEVSCGG